MHLNRRELLGRGLALAGGALLFGAPAGHAFASTAARRRRSMGAPTPAAGGFYTPNRAPLQPTPFQKLPPGAVTARGWLVEQLATQVSGLNGQMTSVSHFCDSQTTGWLNPSQPTGWEEVPYWLRGFCDLGYVTGDSATLSTAASWIDGIVATAQSDGFFGPSYLRTNLSGGPDFWPYFPLLQALCSYQEYSGDSRIVPLLRGFFQYMSAQPVSSLNQSWIDYRWATGYDTILWLYNRTGDQSLLTLMDAAHANAANWMNNLPTPHNVNIAQGFTEPALYGLRAGGSGYSDATYQNYATVMGTYGQFPGGGFAGDENYRPGYTDPRQAFETCGIVEYMQSHETMTRITGDPIWADHCEELAFNLLPAALDPQMVSLHYVTAPNLVQLDNNAKTLGQFDNNWAMLAYLQGVDQYHCCAHNHGQGWPYFTENLWLATPDGGLCASMYAPSAVTAKVGDGSGTVVTFTEDTGYPFSETVTLSLSAPGTVSFPLYVRVPGWCANPGVSVNGTSVAATSGPCFVSIDRTWTSGDTVTLTFPMSTRVTTWSSNHDSVSVAYGPVEFSLRIDENWSRIGGTDQWPQWQVTAGSAWNYGLLLDANDPAGSFTVNSGGTPGQGPLFTQANVPISLEASAQPIAGWQADSQNVVGTLQQSPALGTPPTSTVTLIPMGAARLRVGSLPTVAPGGTVWRADSAWFRIQNQNSGKVLAVSDMSTADSADVVQFDDNGTADHLWTLIPSGDGWFRVLNQNSGMVLGVSDMSTADSAQVVQFDDSGTSDHLWQLVDNGDGWFRLRNQNSGKVLGVSDMSTADSADVVQFDDNGTADHLWRLVPDGWVRIVNQNSGKVLGVSGMSTADSADVVQFDDNGTADHLWSFIPDANGYFRVQNQNSGKVLGVSDMSTADSADVVQFDDNGTADHLWRLRYEDAQWLRLQNQNSGKVLAVSDMSTDDSAQVVQFDDNGTADHLWLIR